MKTLNIIYIIRVCLGIFAALIAALVVDLKVGDPLINGITVALAVYLITYYLLKWQFGTKVEKPTKILSMGIFVYFIVFIMCWVLFVTPSLSAPTVAFTVDPQTAAVDEAITFTSTSEDADGEIVKYVWDFGDETTSEEMNPTHTYSVAGEYTVKLKVVDDHGISMTNTTTLTVNALG
ncbi:MAG: PKD domain-containing protein [Candidatus Bathyarchaeota archaeon]|nr:PKD domain-containing protein [Candidatus Bathyarchaeum sp.]